MRNYVHLVLRQIDQEVDKCSELLQLPPIMILNKNYYVLSLQYYVLLEFAVLPTSF